MFGKKEYAKKYNKEHRKECNLSKKKWRENHPEKWKAIREKYCKENREKINKHNREYNRKHKKEINERRKKKYWEWRAITPYKNNYRNGWETLRVIVLKRDNYTCQICGKKKKVEVHHKDRTGSNRLAKEMNNDLDNLITLCHKCHLILDCPIGGFSKGKSEEKTERNQMIMRMLKSHTQTQVSRKFHLTRQRINQIKTKILNS
jgi:5-methylcytosine-specific restriction endonuclease McrA